jgi:choline kinase
MKAVILAAGMARRLRPLMDDVPKCLIDIGGKTIFEHQLEGIVAAGVGDVVLVVGYKADMISAFVDSLNTGLSFEYIVNPEYERTNTIYSLWLAREKLVGQAFLYFNGDVMVDVEVPRLLAAASSKMCLAVDRKPCGEEEVKVITDGNGRVVEIGKGVDKSKCLGEFIGIAKFCGRPETGFLHVLDTLVQQGNRTAYFELALHALLPTTVVTEIDVSRFRCIEIDFAEDLDRARLLFEESERPQ